MKNIAFSPPDITEAEIIEVGEALRSGWITTGKRTKLFEDRIAAYVGTDKAVCLNSATAAMEMTLRLFGIEAGDEVITSAYTYTATAAVIEHVGAKLVLVDTVPDSFEMDYDQLAAAITERTKMIIPVDIGGRMCDYTAIFNVVEAKRELFFPRNSLQRSFGRIIIMADSAHGFGARRLLDGREVYSGRAADFTCFSFHAVKNLTTAEGGAVTWKHREDIDDEEIYRWFMLYSLHGQNKDAFAKSQLGAWEYDIIYPAYKCNMTDIMAAIGLKQLDRYSALLERRRYITQQYDNAFLPQGLISLTHFDEGNYSSAHLYLLRIPEFEEQKRNELIKELAGHGITANVHYKPLPMMSAYKKLGFNIADYPNAYHQYENEISLPLHTRLSDEEIHYIIEKFNESYEKIKG